MMDSADLLKRQLSIAYLKNLDIYEEDFEGWKTAELLELAAFAEVMIRKQETRVADALSGTLKSRRNNLVDG